MWWHLKVGREFDPQNHRFPGLCRIAHERGDLHPFREGGVVLPHHVISHDTHCTALPLKRSMKARPPSASQNCSSSGFPPLPVRRAARCDSLGTGFAGSSTRLIFASQYMFPVPMQRSQGHRPHHDRGSSDTFGRCRNAACQSISRAPSMFAALAVTSIGCIIDWDYSGWIP